ncbi:MAG: hypothetical protein PHS16_01215 [Candidatus Colwellbacteria bacterium]|jgi:hypothetical protein|nr:hypothetical protein [Candidatus Colwellbacteria bacterium]MCK9497461.1 hypothetical protein [Candidatus Colwellbacteria bacterium]MDD3752539.1 hypothetical protein [Candidatus Colwellbacteria bacterium]MDD4818791.1 hypothetical protein [Candidatus Colwellbacteria bacterium]
MSNLARKAVFWALLTVFLGAGIPLAFYSCGYRLRFDTFEITRSGGIYVKTVPGDAKIFLDGRPIKNNSGILNSGTFINGLTPGKYELSIKKENYLPFTANAEVIPLQADPFEKLVLVPDSFNSLMTGNISDLNVSSGEIIISDGAGKLRYKDKIIAGEKFESFIADNKSVITSIEKEGEKIYFKVSLENPKASTNINEIFWTLKSSKLSLPGKVPVKAIIPHPFDSNRVIISTEAALYVVDLKQFSIEKTGDEADVILKGGSSIYLIRNGSLEYYNLTLRTRSTVIGINDYQKISVSPNGKNIALLWEKNILEIYNTDKKESLRFDLKNQGNIRDIFWHKSSNHIFILSDKGLSFLCTDKERLVPQTIYEDAEKSAYSDGQLYVLSNKEIKTLKF